MTTKVCYQLLLQLGLLGVSNRKKNLAGISRKEFMMKVFVAQRITKSAEGLGPSYQEFCLKFWYDSSILFLTMSHAPSYTDYNMNAAH